jgi:TATA-binding protein-associated factor Taf7
MIIYLKVHSVQTEKASVGTDLMQGTAEELFGFVAEMTKRLLDKNAKDLQDLEGEEGSDRKSEGDHDADGEEKGEENVSKAGNNRISGSSETSAASGTVGAGIEQSRLKWEDRGTFFAHYINNIYCDLEFVT